MCVQSWKFVPVPDTIGGTEKIWPVPGMGWMRPRSHFSQSFNGILFPWTLWIHLPKLKFVAVPVPEIIAGTQKNVVCPWIRPRSLFCPFLRGFCRMDPVNMPAKFEVRSFTHSWDNRGYFKKLGSPWIRQPSLFSQIFKGLLFAWTLWIHPASLKFVALSVPEIIGGTQKIWAVPVYAHAPFSPKFLIGFCLHGLSEYISQIWRS